MRCPHPFVLWLAVRRYLNRYPAPPRRHAPSSIRAQQAYRLAGLAVLWAALIAPGILHAQKIDLNGNGISDIWELVYGAGSLDPNGDADGDGVPNGLECIAGTNPFDSNSVPRIAALAYSSTNFTVSMPCALGKQYQLQSLPVLSGDTGANWTNEMTLVARTGTVVTLSAPADVAGRFFRISISDVDTDGDGVNDWEEYKLGLDPTKAVSNNHLDGNGQPMNDYAYAVGQLAYQNVVTIAAIDPTANQPDPGQNAVNSGMFAVTRGGFPLNTITVNLGLGGPGTGFATEGVDHISLPRSVILPVGANSKTITLTPLANTNRLSPAVAQLNVLPGAGYTVGTFSNASITLYPSQTPAGTGLTGSYYTNASSTYTSSANFSPSNFKFSRVDTNVDFTFSTTTPFANNGYFCVRWSGQVQPQYSETYYFVANTDDGVKLWVNDQLIIDAWTNKTASDLTGTITLQGGIRYDLKMEYYQITSSAAAHLSWYSPSQAKQVIPTSRLYPTNATPSPTAIVSPLTAVGFINQPFSFTVAGANSATRYSAAPLPPGLGFDPNTGLLSGTPTLAGSFEVMLTASNAVGVGASALTVSILDTGSSVIREVWTNAPGINVSDIPIGTPANSTAALGTLEGITDYDDNYGERIRGYVTAPATGNYYFWIAGSDSAELWISNDSEPVNKVRRAYVSPTANPAPPPSNGSASRQWSLQPNQKSDWLALVAGQRYYLEILHKAGAGAADNWAVGWLQDPTGTNNTPGGVVPGYVLSPYYPPPPSVAPGTLYVADMLPASGVTNMCFGSATLRLSADNSKAVLNFSFSGLSSTVTGEHIDNDPYLSSPSLILYDISAASPQPDGSYLWNIRPVGGLLASDVLEILNEGKAYITILSGNYPDGELVGHFERAEGSSSFTAPAPPPAWIDDHADASAASRFLIQATFGPSPGDVAQVQSLGYVNWIANQFSLPSSHHLSLILSNASADPTLPYSGNTIFNDWWRLSVTAPDQLRQRVAFALSEIMVVSDQGVLQDNGLALASYYDTLLDNAFGNFRSLLRAVTLTPAMGLYLNMQGNDKGSLINGTHANENYAREIQQLFSIGLNRLWPDGTLVMDSIGNLVPTYDQNVVMGFAAAFTGWNYYQPNQANGRLPTGFSPSANYTNPMVLVPTHHDLNAKLLLDNVVLPPALGSQADPSSTNFDNYCAQDLELALDSIFNSQNVGPFICRELIQRLVTSSPSPDYLYRVVQKFNDNGSGVRGDLQAVIQAILLDYEARSPAASAAATFGKQREPLLRVTAAARAFPAPDPLTGTYSQTTNQTITVSTSSPHRLGSSGDTVFLSFTDTSGNPAPPSQGYSVTARTPTTFTFNAPNLASGTYTQLVNATISNALTATIDTTNVIFVTITSHAVKIGQPVFLQFPTGQAFDGIYQVISSTNANNFAVYTADSVSRTGACVMPKLTGGGYVVSSKTNLTYSTSMPHGLNPGDSVFINFSAAGSPADGQYRVLTVPDATHFTTLVPSVGNGTQNSATVFPLVAVPLLRSGNVLVQWGTWILNTTDTGSTLSLAQTPLNSPTVFNFFFPNYKFPGPLTTAGLTTPEFQLTSDTTVAWQMNFLEGGLLGNGNNTNGISSFNNGAGAIAIDLGPWMTPANTSNTGIPGLVDSLNSLLCGGQLSASAKTQIVNYAITFAYTTPTYAQMRDRVRAVVHLILTSPDFTIQK
jgi:hypothetical protein